MQLGTATAYLVFDGQKSNRPSRGVKLTFSVWIGKKSLAFAALLWNIYSLGWRASAWRFRLCLHVEEPPESSRASDWKPYECLFDSFYLHLPSHKKSIITSSTSGPHKYQLD